MRGQQMLFPGQALIDGLGGRFLPPHQPTIKQENIGEGGGGEPLLVTFEQWTRGRIVPSLGTNSGANELPFQNWRHFKEAFAPELVARALEQSQIPVTRCLDAFGGSGTTAQIGRASCR